MSDPRKRIAAWVLVVVSAVFVWWGWKQGAYFGSVFYPGAIGLFVLLGLLLAFGPFTARIGGPALVALLALVALAAWTLLSAIWSPTPAAAVLYGWHAALYAAVFAIGLWGAHLLGPRMRLALAPVAIGVAVVGIATAVTLAVGTDFTWYLHEDATLRFPIGYRNANAAFFLIGLWPLVALAAGGWRWQVRALLVGAGSLLVGLSFLCQSRGSVPAAALAGVVLLAVSRDRLRVAIVLALVVLPTLPVLPTLIDLYQHGHADPASVPELRRVAGALAVATAASVLLAAVCFGALGPRVRLGPRASARIFGVAAATSLIAVLVAAGVFVSRHGGPVGFVEQRADEFNRVGYPDLRDQGIRYGANIGSNRHDFWRVAIDEGVDRPLLGAGAGGFEVAYMERRLSDDAPEDPHSVEALMFSELGAPGLLLFLTFAVASVWGALRSRRLGPAAVGLVAGALAAASQWVTQASYDWLWNYPGVTAPAVFLLGAAAAPALLDPHAGTGFRARRSGAVALSALVIVAVPLWLSARFFQQAYGKSGAPAAALADLRRAADLNPLDADPLLLRATIEAQQGDRGAAIADLNEALAREPRNFEARLLLARELASVDPAAARAELLDARRLNPLDPVARALQRRFDSATERGEPAARGSAALEAEEGAPDVTPQDR